MELVGTTMTFNMVEVLTKTPITVLVASLNSRVKTLGLVVVGWITTTRTTM